MFPDRFAWGFLFQHTILVIKVDLCFSLVRPAWKLMSETSAACVGRLWREAQRDSKFRNCGDTLDFFHPERRAFINKRGRAAPPLFCFIFCLVCILI